MDRLPTWLRIAVVVAWGCAGCRLVPQADDVAPLTDELANRLAGRVRMVLDRFPDDESVEPGHPFDTISTLAGTDDQALIPGAGHSRLDTGEPRDTLSTATPWTAPGDKDPEPPARLPEPVVAVSLFAAARSPDDARSVLRSNGSLGRSIETAAAGIARLEPGPTERDRRDYVRGHVALKLLSLLNDQPGDALAPIPGLNVEEQEFWQEICWAFDSYFTNGITDSAERAAQVSDRLRAAVRHLQPQARLVLRHVTFCQRVHGFGVLDRFDTHEFSPGQRMMIYAEVENFTSQPTADGRFRTQLKASIELSQADSEPVERFRFPATRDICEHYRRDYYLTCEFTIPRRIPIGSYVLTLTVIDQLGQKSTTETLRLEVE